MNISKFFLVVIVCFSCTGFLCEETDTVPGEHRFCCENPDCECPDTSVNTAENN